MKTDHPSCFVAVIVQNTIRPHNCNIISKILFFCTVHLTSFCPERWSFLCVREELLRKRKSFWISTAEKHCRSWSKTGCTVHWRCLGFVDDLCSRRKWVLNSIGVAFITYSKKFRKSKKNPPATTKLQTSQRTLLPFLVETVQLCVRPHRWPHPFQLASPLCRMFKTIRWIY